MTGAAGRIRTMATGNKIAAGLLAVMAYLLLIFWRRGEKNAQPMRPGQPAARKKAPVPAKKKQNISPAYTLQLYNQQLKQRVADYNKDYSAQVDAYRAGYQTTWDRLWNSWGGRNTRGGVWILPTDQDYRDYNNYNPPKTTDILTAFRAWMNPPAYSPPVYSPPKA